MKHARLGNNQLLRLDIPLDIQGLIVKIAARGNPKFLRLSKSLSWEAMQGLYELVQLKSPHQAIAFIYSLGRNTLVNILNSTRVKHLPATSSLIRKLYLSFQVELSPPGGLYMAVFRPKLCLELPRMLSLQELILDISDGSSHSFNHMTHPDFVYPPSLTTVRMISVDVDGNKVSFQTRIKPPAPYLKIHLNRLEAVRLRSVLCGRFLTCTTRWHGFPSSQSWRSSTATILQHSIS